MASIQSLDVRVANSDFDTRRVNAAEAACSFLRRQAEFSRPSDKAELAERIWMAYWRMEALGMLVAPRTTRSLLRKKYGYFPKPLILAS